MVAKVISGKDIQGALNYNEQKVMEGKALCIQANLFKKEAGNLNFYEKLARFTDLNEKNIRTKTNTLHISLNFDVTEKLGVHMLNQIASQYMDKIGFGDQPYLVYQHTDTAHPHVHIVTTLIQQNGKRIPIHYLGKNQSEKARNEIETAFGLVQAQSKGKEQKEMIRPVDVEKVVYGKSETRRSIVNIVCMATRSYKYTSLPELNAVLRQYNVTAERGTEKSKMFARKGLMYSLIDQKGKRIGIPVKASAIYSKPTLAFLEKQFKLNEVLRLPLKEPMKKAVDKVLLSKAVTTKEQFKCELEKSGIAVLLRTNTEGRTYGITFVDNQRRVVFNGSDLGKPYSATAILEKLSAKEDTVKPYRPGFTDKVASQEKYTHEAVASTNSMIQDLVTAGDLDRSSPEAALKLGRKRRRRKGRTL
ncbi:relaxase/mobilization nuclease domain-containing protein [Ohtaekwangia koreensis]|uniref:Relaxase/Mobilisation nuclease domain-containing protein n=1 Tax=Ohtaekwangia koreensis TaxID=688867 RepID=A0A1T5MB57_9BACT|nr:relaxase/mobilization nuclease domain-containing protein [Ohtaekwangia koreensis]SKC85088.1 Relaxase/Mobilisation nuclease domain-containing protein [Ohtaekwangia koreensis]